MQAVVKTPRIEIRIKGEIPVKMLSFLKKEYGTQLKLVGKANDSEDPFDSDWYQQIRKEMTPGSNLKLYREMQRLSQTDLGEKLGSIPRQHVSNMENGSRAVSLATAKKLAKIFNVSVEKFV